MTPKEERVWRYLVEHRTDDVERVATECGVDEEFARRLIRRISSENWKQPVAVRDRHVGESNYSTKNIQPWDIWLEYRLNPWDADIVKRVLRDKPGQRKMDYEKIIHVCQERIRQLDEGLS